MKRILVPIGCRSDEGLSAPVIRRLREHLIVDLINLSPQNFGQSYDWIDRRISLHENMEPYDLIFITGDRVEMCAAAAAAFHNKIKIAHFYAGIVNDPITTYDDVDRHCITLWSDIQFCESVEAKEKATDILRIAGLNHKMNAHIVGISHLDDLEVDESVLPHRPHEIYDLLLINHEINGKEKYSGLQSLKEYNFVWKNIVNYTVQIGGNPDGPIGQLGDVYEQNIPRPQFLGLLKNCQRFLTNSSTAVYEAPHFLRPEQILMIGDRNKNRPRGPFKTGASDRIVEILRVYLK